MPCATSPSLTDSSEVKRSPDSNVNWDAVAYDLKDVNWKSVFASPTPAAYAAAATSAPAAKKVEQPKPTSVYKVQAAAIPSSSAAAPSATPKAADKIKTTVDSVVSDLLSGVESLASALGAKVGKNAKSNNGGIWVGDDSAWKAQFTNDNNKPVVLYCWKANGFSGMSVNVNVPEISVGLKSGESVTLSFAADVPAACAPAYSDTKLALFGGLDQTWWEVTFGSSGAFDVSRNVNMNGNSISSKGSKCTSDMNTCVFKCKDSSASSCESGSDYDLYNCDSGNGGGGGYDTVMAGTGGGCSMGSSGETVNVVLS